MMSSGCWKESLRQDPCNLCGGTDFRQLSRRDRNLRILFRKSKKVEFQLDKTAYQQSIDALARHNTWTYHCRTSDVVERIKTIWRRRQERRGAAEELAKIVSLCAGEAVASTLPAEAA